MVSVLIGWLLAYRYVVMLPIATIEGPIISIVAGSLVASGQLNFFWAYAILIIGDMIGDSIYYAIGRYGRMTFIAKYGHFVGLPPERIEQVDQHFLNHAAKTLILGKLAFSFEIPFMVTAGIAQYSYKRFISFMFAGALPKTLLLMSIGYFFGFSVAGTKHDLAYASRIALGVVLSIIVLVIMHTLIVRRARTHKSPGALAYVRWHKRITDVPKQGLEQAQNIINLGSQRAQTVAADATDTKSPRFRRTIARIFLFGLIGSGLVTLALSTHTPQRTFQHIRSSATHILLTAQHRDRLR